MATIPGVEFGYTQPIQMRVDELLSGVKSQIAVKIFGDDLQELARLGDEVAGVLDGIRGAADVKVEAVEGLGYLQITMHRRRLARLGISVAQVRSLIETAIGGRVVTTVPEGDRRTDVVVRLPRAFTADVDNLRELPLASPSGSGCCCARWRPSTWSRDRRRSPARTASAGWWWSSTWSAATSAAGGRGSAADRGGGGAADRLLHHLGRPVRAAAARHGPAPADGAGGAGVHLHPALPQLPRRSGRCC